MDLKRKHELHATTSHKRTNIDKSNVSLNTKSNNLPISDWYAQVRHATESIEGAKYDNEDRFVTLFDGLPGPVFGIFDGHGGTFSAEYLQKHLIQNITGILRQRSLKDKRVKDVSLSIQKEEAKMKQLEDQLAMFMEQKEQLLSIIQSEEVQVNSEKKDESQALLDQIHSATQMIQTAIEETQAKEQIQMESLYRTEIAQVYAEPSILHPSLKEGFRVTDQQILKKSQKDDGSTALLVWLMGGYQAKKNQKPLELVVANTGDCRAVLCRDGLAMPLSVDHKPDHPKERTRIQKAGGSVNYFAGTARVYKESSQFQPGSIFLSVSRAFGDGSLKKPSNVVTSEPEVKRFQVEEEKDFFVILACDGVWDVLSNQDAVDIALKYYNDPKKAAEQIVKEAYKRKSPDNLTATVIQFGWADSQCKKFAEKVWKSTTEETKKEEEEDEEVDMFS
jgi:protein phosphatase 1L